MSASGLKEKYLQRLSAFRQAHGDYKPIEGPFDDSLFSQGPSLYYQIFDKDLRPTKTIYNHSLEELFYMAIDNADRLGTMDNLLRIRSNFSARSMTVADLILTAFVGTADGRLTSMLAAPYQGTQPYELTTTLYAITMSEMIPNSADTPLRIALNVPAGMKKWSSMSRLNLFGSKAANPILLELNTRVNNNQILALRNDPEGCVRYSAQSLAILAQREAGKVEGTKSVEAVVEDKVDIEAAHEPIEAHIHDGLPQGEPAVGLETETPGTEDSKDTSDLLPAVRPALESRSSSALRMNAIMGPLQAARLEDKVHGTADAEAIEANSSHPAFDHINSSSTPETAAEAKLDVIPIIDVSASTPASP